MSDKKAKASVYLVIALIAFICSSAVFAMTGGVDFVFNSDHGDDNNYLSSDDYNQNDNGFDLNDFFDSDDGLSSLKLFIKSKIKEYFS